MVTTIVEFELRRPLRRREARRLAEEMAPAFRRVPGLLRKDFLVGEGGTRFGGVYLWSGRESAERFLREKLLPMIRYSFGAEPEVRCFETPVEVDNRGPRAATRRDTLEEAA